MTHGHHVNLEALTEENSNFRRVLYTGKSMQLVLMSLLPKEEIGLEIHEENDQFFRFESGEGVVIVNNIEYPVKDGDSVIVPMGAKHNVINLSETESLKFYTIYSPAHHEDGTVHATKAEADAAEEEFDGHVTEE
jgi:mannose-6-phosphate isomerase-like protein (cupin superfamily)